MLHEFNYFITFLLIAMGGRLMITILQYLFNTYMEKTRVGFSKDPESDKNKVKFKQMMNITKLHFKAINILSLITLVTGVIGLVLCVVKLVQLILS